MEEQKANGAPKPRWFTIFAGGYLIYLFILFGIFAAFMMPLFRTITSKSPAPITTIVPTPQILVHIPTDKSSIRFENFSSDQKDWSLLYPSGKIDVINGKLILQSNAPNWPAIGQNPFFISASPIYSIYYVQADFMTDVDANEPYGLVFGMDNRLGTFYLFEILPRSKQISLVSIP